jgi:hypothetical protein
MHKHSKGSCIILKEGLMIRGLPSLARLALGPSGLCPGLALHRRSARLRQLLRLLLRHERMATVGKIYTRMHMQDLIDGFHLINYQTTYYNHEEYGWPYSP